MEVVRGATRAAMLLDDTRQQLLQHLHEPDSAAGLSRRLGVPRQRLNYHLKELEREGLVELVEERRKGNCVERVVRATARSFIISPEVLGQLGSEAAAAPDRFSAAYLLAASANTIRDVATLEARAKREGKRLATMTIDADIRFPTTERRAAFAEELSDAVSRLVAKYHDDHAPNGRTFRLLAVIHPTERKTP
jgi:DNA-binding transcriptional ArsR family regulator